MNVEWAFLANSALAGGNVGALGIGIDSFPSLPVSVVPEHMRLPNQVGTGIKFAVVVRFLAKRVECGKAHEVQVVVSDEDGKSVTRAGGNIVPPVHPNLPKGWDQAVISNFDLAVLPTSFGNYHLDIFVDNDHKKQIPFRIIEAPVPPGLQPPASSE